jgi:hypothetical protein
MHGGFYLFIKQCNNLLVNKKNKKLNILKIILCFQGFDFQACLAVWLRVLFK